GVELGSEPLTHQPLPFPPADLAGDEQQSAAGRREHAVAVASRGAELGWIDGATAAGHPGNAPPSIPIAWPLIPRARSSHSSAVRKAISSTSIRRRCGLVTISRSRAASAARPVGPAMLATDRSVIGVST